MYKRLKDLTWSDDVYPVWLMHVLCLGSLCVASFTISCAIWFYSDRDDIEGGGEAVFLGVFCGAFYGVIGGLVLGSATTAITFAAIHMRAFFTRPRTRSELYVKFDEPLNEAQKSLGMARHYIQRVEDTNALEELKVVDRTLSDIRKLVS